MEGGYGAVFAIRVQEPVRICLGCRSKAKSVTTVPAVALAKAGQLTHIVRVRRCFYLILKICY